MRSFGFKSNDGENPENKPLTHQVMTLRNPSEHPQREDVIPLCLQKPFPLTQVKKGIGGDLKMLIWNEMKDGAFFHQLI